MISDREGTADRGFHLAPFIVGLATADMRSYAPPVDFALDLAVRSAAMAHVERLATRFGRDSVPWRALQAGFDFRGTTVKLIAPQGIFKPRSSPCR